MTENGLNIRTIPTKRTEFQADYVLLLGTVENRKGHYPHFLKFLFTDSHCTHLILPEIQTDSSQNQKSTIFANTCFNSIP